MQDAMGWQDCHLHDFSIRNACTNVKERIGIPDEDNEFELNILPGWALFIADYFSTKNSTATYLDDYGDNWEHIVKFEKMLPRAKETKYPRCIDGERACLPEDCGGIHGYGEFLEAIMDPGHDQHEDMLHWAGKASNLNALHLIKSTLTIPGNEKNIPWESTINCEVLPVSHEFPFHAIMYPFKGHRQVKKASL